MLLPDWHIRNLVHTVGLIEPFSECVQDGVISFGCSHAGYDLRLGYKVKIFKNTYCETISPRRFKQDYDGSYDKRLFDTLDNLTQGQAIEIPPHSYILAYSLEYLRIPDYLKGRCVGKSTLARCGLIINTTPLEPAWQGHLTIEIANVSPCPVEIYAGEGIAQLEFEMLSSRPQVNYADKQGKYMAQGPEPISARIKG